MLLSIFTPTYNRAYTLPKLFESLCCQTSKDFEWLIIDDGSTDETEELIENYKLQIANYHTAQGSFPIRYFKQENGGKHRAINRGLKEAHGDLFFIVDSDDSLTPDAVEWINKEYEGIKDDSRFAGLSGIRIHPNGEKIGGGTDFGIIDSNAIEIRDKYRIEGDLAEVFKTEVFRQFLFPEFPGEQFCPEALVWFRIAQHYQLRFVHHGIYVCDYLPDGLSAKIVKIRYRSPLASMTYYSELFRYEKPVQLKMRAATNFWRFASRKHFNQLAKMGMLNVYALIAVPFGIVARINDILHHQCS